jgi:uncharacterized protein DUF4388
VRDSDESGDEPPPRAIGPEEEPSRPTSASGFFARLDSVNLAELIQLHCQRQVRAAFRVSSRSVTGHLFFDRGKVCHATLGALTGLDAVASMLALSAGVFEASTEPWPARCNLEMDASALLLAVLPASSDEKTVEIPAFDARMHAGRGKRGSEAQARLPPARPALLPEFRVRKPESSSRGARPLHTTYFVMHEGRKVGSTKETALGDAAASVREICGRLGQGLALGACFTIELGDIDRVLGIFEPELDHVLAGIADRVSLAPLLDGSASDAAAGSGSEISELPRGEQALWALQDQPGMLGGLIGSRSGLLLASSLSGRSSQRSVAQAAEQLALLFRFCPELQLQASSVEVRFAAHRLVAAVGSAGLVAVLGLASAPVHELRLVAQAIARQLPALAPSEVDHDFELDGELTAVFMRLLQPP